MIDFILFAAIYAAFHGGVICGKKYGTIKASFKAFGAWLSSLFN